LLIIDVFSLSEVHPLNINKKTIMEKPIVILL
jgi:hypothetical protein